MEFEGTIHTIKKEFRKGGGDTENIMGNDAFPFYTTIPSSG